MTIRVLLVDDQTLVRAGFRLILSTEPEIEVIGEASDGAAALEFVRRSCPDVVLMDVRMPRVDGLEATRRLAMVCPGTRVVILTTYDLDEYVFGALQAGATGFLLKDAPPDQLVAAIRAAAAGDALLSPSITRRLIDEFARQPSREPAANLGDLTPREIEVLTLLARGLSNAEIGEELVIGEATVKTHVGRVLMKLGCRDRVQAVIAAYESGIARGGPPRGGGQDQSPE